MRKLFATLLLGGALALGTGKEKASAAPDPLRLSQLPTPSTELAINNTALPELGIEIPPSEIRKALSDLYLGAVNSFILQQETGCFILNEPSEGAEKAVRAYYNNPNLLIATLAELDSVKSPHLSFTAGIKIGDTEYRIEIDPTTGTIIRQKDSLMEMYAISEIGLNSFLQLALMGGFELFEVSGEVRLVEQITEPDAITLLQEAERFAGKGMGVDLSQGLKVIRNRAIRYTFYVGSSDVNLYQAWFEHTENFDSNAPFQFREACGANRASIGNTFTTREVRVTDEELKSFYGSRDLHGLAYHDQDGNRVNIPPYDFIPSIMGFTTDIFTSYFEVFAGFES